MNFTTPPYLIQDVSVQRIMLQVLAALLPGIAVYVWLLGPIVLLQIAIATIACVLAEAGMLKLLNKPLALFLGDGSAIVTAWLIALAFPPLSPWWLIVVDAPGGEAGVVDVPEHVRRGPTRSARRDLDRLEPPV